MTRVGIRCDAGSTVGVGHLVRCLALAEELLARGVEVVVAGDLGDVAWAHAQLARRGLSLLPAPTTPEEHLHLASEQRWDAVVLDGYHLEPGTGAALRSAGLRVLSVVDGDFGDQEADLVLDQNLGSEHRTPPVVGRLLGGVSYSLLRDEIRSLRPAAPPAARDADPVRVLAFFGGTDAYDAGPTVVPLLLRTGLPVDVSVVAPRPDGAETLRALTPGPGQRVEVLGPVDDIGARVRASDLVLSAAGTSTWELCCLGATAGLVAVTANQELGYRRTLKLGVAAGVGRLDELRTEAGAAQGTAVLRDLLTDRGRREELARRAWAEVDGRGRERVADALLEGL